MKSRIFCLPDLFKRIHRSYIISVSKIESYTAEMVEVNGVSIPIGRGYRDIIGKPVEISFPTH